MKEEIKRVYREFFNSDYAEGNISPTMFSEWLDTIELPKQEGRDVSKGEIEKAKTDFLHLAYELAQEKQYQSAGYTAKANKLIKMFDDAIEGKLRQPNHVLKGEVYNLLVECLSVNSPSIPTLPDRL